MIWPAHGGSRPLAAPAGSGATLTAVTYSPDGRWLTVGGKDGLTRVWRLNGQGRPSATVASLPGSGAITSLAFSHDSRFLALGTASRVARVMSTSGWNTVATLPHPVGVTGVAFSDRDRRVLSSDVAGSTMLWQFPSPSSYTSGSAVTRLSFSLTKPLLAVSTARGTRQLWDVVNEWHPSPVGSWNATPLSTAPTNAYWMRLAQTATSTATTSSATTTTAVLNPAAGDKALQQTRSLTEVTASLLSPTGQLFVAAGADHAVYLWNVVDPTAPKLLNTLTGPTTPITRLALSPDGRRLAIATSAGHIWLFGVGSPAKASLQAKLIAARGKVTALAFGPTDDLLVAGGQDRRLTFWHYRPYQAVNRICALAGTPLTANEWATYVPEASYNPPCANWTPPVATGAPQGVRLAPCVTDSRHLAASGRAWRAGSADNRGFFIFGLGRRGVRDREQRCRARKQRTGGVAVVSASTNVSPSISRQRQRPVATTLAVLGTCLRMPISPK